MNETSINIQLAILLSMRESELLAHIYKRSADLGDHVVVGPGDDCAVVRLAKDGPLTLLTTDQLVEGRHYDPQSTSLDLIARKAVARSVSDIAAMGGRPTCGLATATLNSQFTQGDELFDAMARWARHWSCPLVGGDIAIHDGPTVLTTTVLGACYVKQAPVLRSHARPGDRVCVTGQLGRSLERGTHLTFEPRVREAESLCESLGDRLGAMIDLSDGLGRDAARIAKASSVRILLEAPGLPCAAGADWKHALADGEDYELCFTARGDVPPAVCGVPISIVGDVVEGEGCFIHTPDGDEVDTTSYGWDHHA